MAAPALEARAEGLRLEGALQLAVQWGPVALIVVFAPHRAGSGSARASGPAGDRHHEHPLRRLLRPIFGTDHAGRDLWVAGMGVRYSLDQHSDRRRCGRHRHGDRAWRACFVARSMRCSPRDGRLPRVPVPDTAIAIASAVDLTSTTVVVADSGLRPGYARMVRGQVLALKELAFVAHALPAPTLMILFRHLLRICCLSSARVPWMPLRGARHDRTQLPGARRPADARSNDHRRAHSHLLGRLVVHHAPGLPVLAMVLPRWLPRLARGRNKRCFSDGGSQAGRFSRLGDGLRGPDLTVASIGPGGCRPYATSRPRSAAARSSPSSGRPAAASRRLPVRSSACSHQRPRRRAASR